MLSCQSVLSTRPSSTVVSSSRIVGIVFIDIISQSQSRKDDAHNKDQVNCAKASNILVFYDVTAIHCQIRVRDGRLSIHQ